MRDLLSAASQGRVGELRKWLARMTPAALDAPIALGSMAPGAATLLVTAADAGQAGAVEMLLEHGADINAPASDGCTALMAVASHADAGLLKYLLSRGADPTLVDQSGSDAAEHAREMGRQRPNDPTWEQHVRDCVAALDGADAAWRRARALRRWRVVTSVVLLLHEWHMRAAERAYRPGGLGYACASEHFEAAAAAVAAAAAGDGGHEADAGKATPLCASLTRMQRAPLSDVQRMEDRMGDSW